MKYLKRFEGLTTQGWVRLPPIAQSAVNKIKSDIKDICIELTDTEFDVEITDNKEKLRWLYRKNDVGRYQIDVTITKGILRDGVRKMKSIEFIEIYDYIEMVKDYLKEYPIEVSYMIDGINYNEEEYIYYTQRRIDKNHKHHDDIRNISMFKIKIKLEDEASK